MNLSPKFVKARSVKAVLAFVNVSASKKSSITEKIVI